MYGQFKNRRTSVTDEQRPSRLVEASTPWLETHTDDIILEDRRIAVKNTAKAVAVKFWHSS